MKTHRLARIALLVLILTPCLETSAQDKRWLSYEPAIVDLEGKLTVEEKFGPPNFGENPKTDAKVTVPILVLIEPVSIHGNPQYFPFNVEVAGIKRIQLICEPGTRYDRLVGKRVVLKGTLFHAHTGGHYTDVVMDVQSIKVKRRRRK